MRITAAASVWMCAAFALVCFGVAAVGFFSLPDAADASLRDDSIGYALFWTFLGTIGVVFGALSWMIKEGKLGAQE
ncbi:MAG: hypothetical protein JO035_08905 [Betaproteobacteria bacterium]|nr:hypothetical protein [Betaproteobacteria bacterium]